MDSVSVEMNNHNPHEMYYDGIGSTRSAGSHQHQLHHHPQHQQHQHPHQNLPRQPSRGFENFAPGPGGLYTAEDHAARYDGRGYDTSRLNAGLMGNYGYDIHGAQTWNTTGFGGGGPFGMAGTGRLKTNSRQQRNAIPSVSTLHTSSSTNTSSCLLLCINAS